MSYLYRVFLKGLLTLLPIIITVYLLTWIATTAESFFGGPLRASLPEAFYFPGAGVVLVVILIAATGALVNSYFTKTFFEWLENQLKKTPIIRSIYSPIRDVTNLFAHDANSVNQRVVMVRIGEIDAMGLVTRDQFDDLPHDMVRPDSVAVFIPFSYGMGGFTVVVPKSHLRETSLPAEKAMQLAITGWIKSGHK